LIADLEEQRDLGRGRVLRRVSCVSRDGDTKRYRLRKGVRAYSCTLVFAGGNEGNAYVEVPPGERSLGRWAYLPSDFLQPTR